MTCKNNRMERQLNERHKYSDHQVSNLTDAQHGTLLSRQRHDFKQGLLLNPLGKNIKVELKLRKRLDGLKEWVKGQRVFEKKNLLVAWSVDSLCFYSL
jgi:hypothetical protein